MSTQIMQSSFINLIEDNNSLQLYGLDAAIDHQSLVGDDFDRVRHSHGAIYRGQEKVVPAWPLTKEITDQDLLDPYIRADILQIIEAGGIIMESHEGALVRLFFTGETNKDYGLGPNGWQLATHKKLNAFESRWGCDQSFGELFKESEGKFIEYNKLNPELCHVFLISSNQRNRIVCDRDSNNSKLYYIASMNKMNELSFCSVGITLPKILSFNSLNGDVCNQMYEFLQTKDLHKRIQGLVILHQQCVVKIYSKQYYELLKLRNNHSSAMFAYIENMRKNPTIPLTKNENVRTYKRLYPEHKKMFTEYDQAVMWLVLNTFDVYKERYINKKEVKTSPMQHLFLKACHAWHWKNRFANKIDDIEKVLKIFFTMKPHEQKRLIEEAKEKSKAEQEASFYYYVAYNRYETHDETHEDHLNPYEDVTQDDINNHLKNEYNAFHLMVSNELLA